MEQLNVADLVQWPPIIAVGLKWEGTFAEAAAGGIHVVQAELRRRLGTVERTSRPDRLLGLSYHAAPGAERFIHFAAVEVSAAEVVPEGMGVIEVPAFAYAQCRHLRGQQIDATYRNLYAWIAERGLRPHEGGLTHLELYPAEQDPFAPDPEFTILIPLEDE
ncbi:GyrI-like domain-containing protein [Paenibacillus sp. IB182496]|uniref:GyrI-like domain-containing protein n=1 Tax=Paenibacillus sabuli TaxID=2772509 RepID=A0A927GSU5_9BACL|nr:GyrI-like domain-containing protein [Paenibacillus sabuli]MBD2846933.1 GyrI-like domain-containing protein [Paenibacillus sabuli]